MKNLNVLETFRTKEELKNYFEEKGQTITEEEIENLKKSYEQTEKAKGTLSLQQLNDVAGGEKTLKGLYIEVFPLRGFHSTERCCEKAEIGRVATFDSGNSRYFVSQQEEEGVKVKIIPPNICASEHNQYVVSEESEEYAYTLKVVCRNLPQIYSSTDGKNFFGQTHSSSSYEEPTELQNQLETASLKLALSKGWIQRFDTEE